MDIAILFHDESLLIINKPPGMVVNRAQSVKTETVQDWVESTHPLPSETTETTNSENKPAHNVSATSNNAPVYDIEQEFRSRSGIVHRIDKETSGILVIAKTADAFGAMKQQFMERTVSKTYLAIVHDRLPSTEGEINAPIDRLPWNKEQWGVVPSGKESLTLYKVLKTMHRQVKKSIEWFQLVECSPKTGRTHQIRVHLKYLNRPILGDYLYAGRKTARDDRTWVPRVMLHAHKISFLHPISHLPVEVEAPLPDDMQQVIEKLQV